MSYIDKGFRSGWYAAQYEVSYYEGSPIYESPAGIDYPEELRGDGRWEPDPANRAAFDFGHRSGWNHFFKQGASSE